MDAILYKFKNDAITALGDNLVCLLHHGSRAKGEAHPGSDYDIIIIVKGIDEGILHDLRNLFVRHPRFSAYVLSLRDLETLPKGNLLQFAYAKPLYGEIRVCAPTSEEVKQYIRHSRREWLDTLRHNLLFPHPLDKKARLAYYLLKNVYIYLSYLAFCESGKLPPTRKQTIEYFDKRKGFSYGCRLLQILDRWNEYKDKVARNPDRHLFMVEKFLRSAHP